MFVYWRNYIPNEVKTFVYVYHEYACKDISQTALAEWVLLGDKFLSFRLCCVWGTSGDYTAVSQKYDVQCKPQVGNWWELSINIRSHTTQFFVMHWNLEQQQPVIKVK